MIGFELIVALFAAFLAGTVSGLTGFGLALISVPLLLFIYEPPTVILLTSVFSLVVNVAVVRDSWREVDRRMVAALLFPSLAGVVIGVEILRAVDPLYIRVGVGVVVVVSAALLLREVRLPGAQTRWGPLVSGFSSGVLSTSTGLAGPPIVLLLASRKYAKLAFRSSSALYFLLISPFGLVILFLRDVLPISNLPLALILVPAAIAGKALGTAILRRTSESAFRKLTLFFTLATGALGAATAAWAILT